MAFVPDKPTGRFVPDTPVKPVTVGPESFKQSLREVIAEDAFPHGAEFVAGIGTALDNAALRLKQVFSTLTPEDQQKILANREITGTGGGLVGNIAGNMMGLGRLPGALAGATMRVAPSVVTPVATSAALGATLAPATTPLVGNETALGTAATGAVGGAAGHAIATGLSRAIQPIAQSDAVQTLLRHNVVPTVGQAAGKNSVFGRAEQAAESIPVVGHVISGARNRAGVEFNRAALNQAVPEGQPNVTQIGNLGRDEVRQATEANYQRLFSGTQVRPDANLAHDLVSAANQVQLPLSQRGMSTYQNILQRVLWDRIPTVNLGAGATQQVGSDFMKREIIGDLGKRSQEFLRSPIAEERAIGEALKNARNATQNWLINSAGIPRAEVAAADAAYVARSATRNAAEMAKAREGQFTPLQLLRSSPEGSASNRLAAAGQEVLPNTLPNSGTADRGMLAALLTAAAGGGGAALGGTPLSLMALALAPAAYSRTGARYAIGDLMPRAQPYLSNMLRTNAPNAAISGVEFNQNSQNRLRELLGQ